MFLLNTTIKQLIKGRLINPALEKTFSSFLVLFDVNNCSFHISNIKLRNINFKNNDFDHFALESKNISQVYRAFVVDTTSASATKGSRESAYPRPKCT